MIALANLAWPASRLGEALDLLARRSGLATLTTAPLVPPSTIVAQPGDALDQWIERAAEYLGLEAELVEASWPELDLLARRAAPALLLLPGEGQPQFLLLLAGGQHVTVLSSQWKEVRVAPHRITGVLRQALERPLTAQVERLADAAQVSRWRRGRLREALLAELASGTQMGGCWLIRTGTATGSLAAARRAGLLHRLGAVLTTHAAEYGLRIASWWILGSMALAGRIEPGWLVAWLLTLLTAIPLRLLTTAGGGRLAIETGLALRRRLLEGALQLEPDALRHMGTGQLLGRINESEMIEQMAIAGGLSALTAVIELLMAAVVLSFATAGGWYVALLMAWSLVVGFLAVRYFQWLRQWTSARMELTNDLVEQMIGHRTRLAQERSDGWNVGEDQALEHYVDTSARLDQVGARLQAVAGRGWLIVAVLALAPTFVFGQPTMAPLAIAIGGIVLAMRAFQTLAEGAERLAAAALAWQAASPLWEAAQATALVGDPAVISTAASDESAQQRSPAKPEARPLLTARGLRFQYRDRAAYVLNGVDLQIKRGDRLLLEGPSGSGKSTLAAVLAGARSPDVGLVLCDGLDINTVGTHAWRRKVAMVPQFHDNHVLMGSFAFNALLGRDWPATPADMDEVVAVCRGLGLSAVLERMPGNVNQIVGETGWQLSHGEKSRLYIARALLQRADCLLLDESFGALDPETFEHVCRFVLERATTLVVIAHP